MEGEIGMEGEGSKLRPAVQQKAPISWATVPMQAGTTAAELTMMVMEMWISSSTFGSMSPTMA